MLEKLLGHPDNPDPEARITSVKKMRADRPVKEFHRISELFGGTTEVPVGVKVLHRRPKEIVEVHIHSKVPAEMMAFLTKALSGYLRPHPAAPEAA